MPRPQPIEGLRTVNAELIESSNGTDLHCRLVLLNDSCRNVRISSTDVLAELVSESKVDWLEAIVGPSCESAIVVEGISATCLIDSGSQVTIVSETFYRTNLSHVPLRTLDNELHICGAGGQTVPYLGYISVNVLPQEIVGVKASVDTMMIVCPDTEYSARVPFIVGTNTFRLYAQMCGNVSGIDHFATTLPMCGEVSFMYKDLLCSGDGRLGSLKSRNLILIPAGEVVGIKCQTRIRPPCTREAVVVQEPTVRPLPDGLKVVSGKVSTGNLSRLKVLVRNDSNHDVMVKKNQVLADVFLYREEYNIHKVLQDLVPQSPDLSSPVHACHVNVNQEKPSDVSGNNIQFQFGEDLPSDFRERFSTKLNKYSDVFIKHEFDIGRAETGTLFDIDLKPGPDLRERARPLSPKDFEDCRQHIQGLLDAKIIRPSNSPFSSPIVLLRKKSGALRMCIDYRRVNSRTVRDSYSIPKIDDLFLTLNGAKYFTSLDLCKAYYQVPITERASKVSAFITPFGLFEWDRLSQGLVNAPACFQRLIETVFSDMNLVQLIVFLDDILVHAKTLEELEERTLKVVDRLRTFKLKLDPAKCIFGTTTVRHLGYVISEGAIRPDPDKISAVTTWPQPQTVKDVKSFVGFAGFYRKFIPNFSRLVKPLNGLTVGYAPGAKLQKRKSGCGTLTLSSNISHLWGKDQDEAFEATKRALTGDLVLGIADRTRPFTLHCDASITALGAILYQEYDGKLRVIAYASRGLNKTEQNYPAHKREFLALKWSMTEKFSDYLLGTRVTVVTDNNPLCYVLKNAKLDATGHRWLSSLSLYDFQLRYKKGSLHTDADLLSRRPHPRRG